MRRDGRPIASQDNRDVGAAVGALPFNLAVTAVACCARFAPTVERGRRRAADDPDQRRQDDQGAATGPLVSRAGHRVVLVESAKYWLTGHRFSRAVDAFYTVPNPEADEYADALVDIVETEGVDVYVPVCSPTASYFDARAKGAVPEHCEVVHLDETQVNRLDDKYAFSVIASSLGLLVPESYRITDRRQVLDFDFARRSEVHPEEHRLRPGPTAGPDATPLRDTGTDGGIRQQPADLRDESLDHAGVHPRGRVLHPQHGA